MVARYIHHSLVTALLTVLAPAALHAQAAEGLSFEHEVGVVSDYRYRGLSLSDEKPALQAGATLNAPGGWYVGTWGSTIEEYGVGADGDGAKVEIDLFAGRAFSLGAYGLDVAVQGYVYSDGSDVNFVELPVSVSRTAGAWTWTLGGAYAPSQGAALGDSNRYVFGRAVWQAADQPWSVTARVGREKGAFAPDGKWDWEVGAARQFGPVSVGVSLCGHRRRRRRQRGGGFGEGRVLVRASCARTLRARLWAPARERAHL